MQVPEFLVTMSLGFLEFGMVAATITGMIHSEVNTKKEEKKYYVYDANIDEFVETEKNKLVRRQEH